RRRALVARRQGDLLRAARARLDALEDLHAAGAPGREVDRGASRGRRPALPAGSRRVHEARLHASLPRSGGGRDAAPAHGRALERGGPLRRPIGSGRLRLDTRRQDAGVRRAARLDRDPGDLTWAPDGKAIYFTAPDRGAINVHVADLAGGVRDVTQGAQVVTLASVARTLVAVGVLSDPTHPADVVRIDLRKPQGLARLTHVNDDIVADKRLARTEEIWYGSSGGTRVQGWIVTPPSFTAGKKYPL